ncbi:MAG: M23 family metallopeptidase [Bacteroidota bacterium]
MTTRILLLFVFGWCVEHVHAQHAQEKVSVQAVERAQGLGITVHNRNIFPITIELELSLKNMTASKRLPLTTVIPPQTEKTIVTLKAIDPGEQSSYRSKYTYHMGSMDAKHDNSFAYRLPFKRDKSVRIDQGYGGAFSHRGEAEFALDFHLEEGSEITAARGGVVVSLEEKYKEGGTDSYFSDKANYVTILHSDGTFGEYAHLRYNGVRVREGQRVVIGQVIGYSGATGYVTGPHLHFAVKRITEAGKYETIPVRFATRNGIQQLEEGKTYSGY